MSSGLYHALSTEANRKSLECMKAIRISTENSRRRRITRLVTLSDGDGETYFIISLFFFVLLQKKG